MSDRQVVQPSITLTIRSADTVVPNTDQRVLLVGQKTAAGSATAGALTSDIQNDGSWDALFGPTSMLAGMARNFRLNNQVTRLDAIALDDDGGAVDATGVVAFVGAATADGELTVIVGSGTNHSFNLQVTSGDTATAIGTALETAVTADSNVPVTAANVTGTVTMTAENGGTVGNGIALIVEGTVAGITHSVTGMASGTTDPSLTGVFDVVGDERYQTVSWPFEYGVSGLTDFLDPRFNATNKVLDGVGVVTQTDTFTNVGSAAAAENSQSLLMLRNEVVSETSYDGGALKELDYVISAEFCALRSLRLTSGANISSIVIAPNGARDSFGGPAIASLPYFNTPFRLLPIIDVDKGFTDTEAESLLDDGSSGLGNNISRTLVIANEMVTTYKTDAASNPDISFKFLNFVDTIVNIREFMFNNLRSDFAQTRLTDGPLQGGRAMANEGSIRANVVGYYKTLSGADFVLTQAGEPALEFFRENLIVDVNLATGTVTITMETPIVTQLREIIATIQIAFDLNA